jgi:putative peptide zinc metalloprotease protein
VDRRFERKLWWLLILLLLLALLLTGANFLTGPAWSEMRDDHALLHVSDGTVTATIDGTPRVLGRGDEAYVSSTDVVQVWQRSDARLTFRGGGYSVLCGGTRLTVGPLSSPGTPAAPAGSLAMDYGKLLTYTRGTSSAFLPLALRIQSDGRQIQNSGAAAYSVGWDGVDDSNGEVTRGNRLLIPTGDQLSCGNPGTPGPGTSASPSPTPSPSGSPSPSASPSASPSPTLSPTPRRSPTTRPTTQGPPPPPPPNNPPTIGGATIRSKTIVALSSGPSPAPCRLGAPTTTDVILNVVDTDGPSPLSVNVSYVVEGYPNSQKSASAAPSGTNTFTATLGPLLDTADTTYTAPIDFTVTASDGRNTVSKTFAALIIFQNCNFG